MQEFHVVRDRFRQALVALAEFVRVDRSLSARLDEARREFFAGMEPEAGPDRDRAAQRFLEWFALERRVGQGAGAPVHAFLALGCPGLDQDAVASVHALADSFVGVFRVDELDAEALEVEDTVTQERFQVRLPRGDRRPEAGDTLIGRLAPVPGEPGWFATDAVERLPGNELYTALRDDAERARLEQGLDRLPALTQLEVERLLWARPGAEAPQTVAALERELAALLAGAEGAELPSPAEVRAAFAAAETPGQVIGPLLELLAFHTDVDLDRARRVLLELSNVWTTTRPADEDADVGDIPVEDLGSRLVAELEAGEQRGEDLEQLFDRLERMIDGTSSGPGIEGPPPEIRWETEDRGELDGLLEEFAWDLGRQGRGPSPASLERLRGFVDRCRAGGRVELQAVDVGALAACLIEAYGRGDHDACRALLQDLSAFEDWLRDEQELALGTSVAAFAARLEADIVRLARATADLSTSNGATSATRPGSWRVEDGGDGLRLVGPRGTLEVEGTADLEPGDLVLGSPGEGGFAPGLVIVPALLAGALVRSDAAE
ncbi:MAG: hypothetical protein R3F30_10825 [Planctomycetota bacterium]